MTSATVEQPKTRSKRRAAVPPDAMPVETIVQPPTQVKIGNLHISLSGPSHSSEMSSEIVTITPQMATEMLQRSQDNGALNRAVKQNRVERYARDMRDDNWRLTGESIKLDTKGNVRDGQNRLFACVEAGVPFTTFVTINVPDGAFDVMDSGAPRSAADVMFIHQYENPRQVAASARYAVSWERNGRPDNNTYVAKAELLRWLARNPKFVDYVALGRKIQRAGIPGGESIWATTLWRLSEIDAEEAEKFAHAIATGAGLSAENGALMLRNRMIMAKSRGEKLSVTEVAALIIKGWNAWRSGEQMRQLSWRQGGSAPESFPKPS